MTVNSLYHYCIGPAQQKNIFNKKNTTSLRYKDTTILAKTLKLIENQIQKNASLGAKNNLT